MRVALLSRAFHPSLGGAERFAEILAHWLGRNGHQVTVLTRSPGDAAEDRDRFTHAVVRQPTQLQLVTTLRRAEIVHINGLSARSAAGAFVAGQRPVFTHIGHQAICPTGLAMGDPGVCAAAGGAIGPCGECPARRFAFWRRSAVRVHRGAAAIARLNVSVSSYLARRLDLPRTRVIHNPVPSGAFTPPVTEPSRHLLYVGRLVTEKGVDRLLNAIRDLPDVTLDVVGGGPTMNDLVRLRDHLGLQSRVRFLGPRSPQEVPEIIAGASTLCVPSIVNEAFGYTAAEGMAAGRVVVTTPMGALPELIGADRGYVAVDCTPLGIARAVEKALADPLEAIRRASRAQQFARAHFDIESIGPKYLAAYTE